MFSALQASTEYPIDPLYHFLSKELANLAGLVSWQLDSPSKKEKKKQIVQDKAIINVLVT